MRKNRPRRKWEERGWEEVEKRDTEGIGGEGRRIKRKQREKGKVEGQRSGIRDEEGRSGRKRWEKRMKTIKSGGKGKGKEGR